MLLHDVYTGLGLISGDANGFTRHRQTLTRSLESTARAFHRRIVFFPNCLSQIHCDTLPANMSSPLLPKHWSFRSSAGLLSTIAILTLCGCVMTMTDSIRALPDDLHAPVVAVTSFENRSGFAGQWQLGSGMADLLVSELVQSRNFNVVEREHFEGLANELRRQQTPLFRKEGKTPIGRMKNAQYLIRGVVNDFSQTGGGSFFVAVRSLFFGGRGYNARVALTLTLVDIETGQIIASVQSTGLVRAREAYVKTKYEGVAFGGDVFFTTPLGKATARAIHGGVSQITKEMPKNPWRPMISCMKNDVVILNGGKDRDFRERTIYIVRASAEPITDPATGDVLTYLPGVRVGTIRVTRVDDKVAFAEILQGSNFERGQSLTEVKSNSTVDP
jgi:curli biogenesis system outer membrane secretion channel CsgG